MTQPVRATSPDASWRAALVGLTLLVAGPAFAEDFAGVASAVVPDATVTPPGGEARIVAVGQQLREKERLVTGPNGQMSVLFQDGTSLTLGPNSEVDLSEYKFSPDQENKLALFARKGTLRVVGGKISKETPVQVRTPATLLGVRGGIVLIAVNPGSGATEATLAFGEELTVANASGSGSVIIKRPGFASTVATATAIPTPPAPSSQTLFAQLSSLEGAPGTTAATSAGAASVQSAGASSGTAINQASVAQSQQTTTQNSAAKAAPPPAAAATGTAVADTSITAAQPAAVQNVIATGAPTDAVLTANGLIVPGPPIFAAYTVTNDTTLNSPIPFLSGMSLPVTNLRSTPFFFVSTNGIFAASTGDVKNSGYQASLNFDGATPAAQSFEILVATGILSTQSSATANDRERYFTGSFAGATQVNGSTAFFSSLGDLTSITPSSGLFRGSNFPTSFTIDTSRTDFGTTSAATALTGQAFPVPTTTPYSFTDTLTKTAAPVDLGVNRTSQTLNGHAAALSQSFSPLGTVYLSTTTLLGPVGVAIATDATNSSVTATIDTRPVFGAAGPILHHVYGSGNRSAFIDDSRFAALPALDMSGGPAAVYPELSTLDGMPVTGETAGRQSAGYLVASTGIAPTALLPNGASFCECRFLQWGFFGYSYGANFQAKEQAHPGLFVAGPLPALNDIPLTGTATFTGHAIGNVISPAGTYVAAGAFSQVWNFAPRTGNITISNFDGATYTAAIGAANRRDYSGTLMDATATRTGAVAGSFYRGAGDPTKETGGQFRVQGGGYAAAGIFAGVKN